MIPFVVGIWPVVEAYADHEDRPQFLHVRQLVGYSAVPMLPMIELRKLRNVAPEEAFERAGT